MKEDRFNVYCEICGACGEEGCCPATICQHHKDGKYCVGYIQDLQFGYLMFQDMYNMCDRTNEHKIDKLWEKNYKLIYEK